MEETLRKLLGEKTVAVPELGAQLHLLSAKETRTTRAGKPFYKLRVSDRTGTVDCTVWEIDQMEEGAGAGDLVQVSARVTEYQGKAQLEASSVAVAPSDSACPPQNAKNRTFQRGS